jgi:hypothetical protein
MSTPKIQITGSIDAIEVARVEILVLLDKLVIESRNCYFLPFFHYCLNLTFITFLIIV